MTNSIGKIIRKSRLEQNIKQAWLANGICSISYLSKIENNAIVSKEDILKLLLKRLNIEIKEVTNEEEFDYIDSLYLLYKESILTRKKEEINNSLHKFQEKDLNFTVLTNYHYYYLYMFRLMLINREKKDVLLNLFNMLKTEENDYNQKQCFIYNLNSGLFLYLQGNYQEALLFLEKSLPILEFLNLEEWELTDYYNVLSVSYLRVDNYYSAIKYGEKALRFYKDNHYFERTI